MRSECIVNVSTGIHVRGQARLVRGLARVGYDGDILTWTNELPKGSPSHDESPFGFKPFAIKDAIESGHKLILWLDGNYIPIRNLEKIFKKIRRDGHFMYSVGANFGEWCSDLALRVFGIDRERSFSILELNASCVGINANSLDAMRFLDEWCEYARDGTVFRGIDRKLPFSQSLSNDGMVVSADPRVRGHRHDQTCASFLAWKHGMKLSSMEVANYQSVGVSGENVYSKTIPLTAAILLCRDAKREREDYISDIDRYGNHTGLGRLRFVALSLVATARKLLAFRALRSITRRRGYYAAETRPGRGADS